MSLRNFTYLSDLGEGSYGRVIKAKRNSDGEIYAIKQVKVSAAYEKELESTLNEIRILASINHQNIIGYKEAFYEVDNESLCIVMEFADGGDLQHRIMNNEKKKIRFEQREIWRIAEQLLKGLKLLEQYKVIHRDIKSANIFFSKGIAKLGDMNVSKITQTSFASTQTGTPYYTSPEIWRGVQYSYKSDIWSLGCVLYEICAGSPPFKANNISALSKKVQQGVYDKIPSIYSLRLSNFISACLTLDVNKRADVHKLLRVFNSESSRPLSRPGSLNKIIIHEIQVPDNMEQLNKLLPKPHYQEINNLPQTNVLDKFLRVQQSPLHRRQTKLKQIRSQQNLHLKSPKVEYSKHQPISLQHIPDDDTYIGQLIKKKQIDIQALKKRPIVQRMEKYKEKPVQKLEGVGMKRQKLSIANIDFRGGQKW